MIAAIHTAHAGWPTVAHTPPIVNSTPAGTPLVTQNASFQLRPRCSVWPLSSCEMVASISLVLRARSPA
ncbi:hypothetical protein BURPSS13_C0170 [Burkholderia pseudomallei S13]|nr:hypothetical protein BURPSS13_C0170 [Burkholderia pseudomallei S13]